MKLIGETSKLPARPKRSPRGRIKDESHLRRVAGLPCMHCGTEDGTIVPHHYEGSGLALKCDDYKTVPLCHECHIVWWHSQGHLPEIDREESLKRMRSFGKHLLARFFGSEF